MNFVWLPIAIKTPVLPLLYIEVNQFTNKNKQTNTSIYNALSNIFAAISLSLSSSNNIYKFQPLTFSLYSSTAASTTVSELLSTVSMRPTGIIINTIIELLSNDL